MNSRRNLKLIDDLDMESLRLFGKVSLNTVALLDGDNGHFFAKDFQGYLLHEQTDGVGSAG